MSDSPAGSTLPQGDSDQPLRADIGVRWILYVVLAAVLVATALGLLGSTTSVAAAHHPAGSLEVHYPSVTRSGMPARLRIDLVGSEPLPAQIDVEITTGYLRFLDHHSLRPQPNEEYSGSEVTRWSFDVPEGAKDFRLTLDARIEPGTQGDRSATVRVTGGALDLDVAVTTTVRP